MNIIIYPQKLSGQIAAIPSKSHAHRALICAAFAQGDTNLVLNQVNDDIEATASCLTSLGASIIRTEHGYQISPIVSPPETAVLNCRESGSTLRFLLPIVGALGVQATLLTAGRLGKRPLSPLWEEMERMGCSLSRGESGDIHCSGKLKSGLYRIAGNVSSQFISGLLFAGTLMDGGIEIQLTSPLESAPYVEMTRSVLTQFGAKLQGLAVKAGYPLVSPGTVLVEGDWSNAAFFLTANATGSSIRVTGLEPNSSQGDRQILQCLNMLKNQETISASDIPDLIPILSVAGTVLGARFTNIRRLRLKESDRVDAIVNMIKALGGAAEATEEFLHIFPVPLTGGIVDSCNDHRIAMSAAIAATLCTQTVTILGAEAVNKSYPRFWEDYRRLGGNYEQYLR